MRTSFILEELWEFLLRAKAKTYAGGGEWVKKPERDGFHEFIYNEIDWEYRDSYTGWYRSHGSEIVRFQTLPVWGASYSGGMSEDDKHLTHQTFEFLKKVLSVDNKGFNSFRGPMALTLGEWVYNYQQDGTIEAFWGEETIEFEKKLVFSQKIIGGLIRHQE